MYSKTSQYHPLLCTRGLLLSVLLLKSGSFNLFDSYLAHGISSSSSI